MSVRTAYTTMPTSLADYLWFSFAASESVAQLYRKS